jgi:hypothetical protein
LEVTGPEHIIEHAKEEIHKLGVRMRDDSGNVVEYAASSSEELLNNYLKLF